MMLSSETPLLDVQDLTVTLSTADGQIRPSDGVSFALRPGERLGLVGESGSGKSITALSLARLLPPQARVRSGHVMFESTDLMALSEPEMRRLRGSKIGFVFQDSTTSLNPTLTIGYQVAESLRIHAGRSKREARAETIDLLDRVGLPEPVQRYASFPHQLSGGQRQRVAIAMAIACKPRLIIADEPTTALDVSVQGQILGLLSELVTETQAAVLLITHDLAAAADFCDRIAVMYAGRIVESAPARVVENGARMPYTQALLDCIPRLDEDLDALAEPIKGSPPNLLALPPGCSFQPRCLVARDVCSAQVPELVELSQGHLSRCVGAQEGGWW